ncbi:MAG TPA: sulfide/dihydroorotate dehydrogenase-like FAD/NAD-binding protein [Firmicutes bacterium]|nr:sulfide/dihydroorotate dehydrogenase-like FAD/NAD-binding protein [Bacillota bacterium]
MFKIIEKRRLNDAMTLMKLDAPHIARKAKPGQFVILRVDEHGERIPLTVNDTDPDGGSVTIIFQIVGQTTRLLDSYEEGESIQDLVGPLGMPTHLEGIKRAAVIGGGAGCAIAYPQAKALFNMGAHVDMIAGFRNKDIIILADEMRAVSSRLFITTDDGSNGHKGFVTDVLKSLLEKGEKYDAVIAIGPLPMMKAVCAVTDNPRIKTIVSMNPIMIDGTGMCGGCRVVVGGEVKFACVDGPDFDGHLVDFDSARQRLAMYKEEESHACRLRGQIQDA